MTSATLGVTLGIIVSTLLLPVGFLYLRSNVTRIQPWQIEEATAASRVAIALGRFAADVIILFAMLAALTLPAGSWAGWSAAARSNIWHITLTLWIVAGPSLMGLAAIRIFLDPSGHARRPRRYPVLLHLDRRGGGAGGREHAAFLLCGQHARHDRLRATAGRPCPDGHGIVHHRLHPGSAGARAAGHDGRNPRARVSRLPLHLGHDRHRAGSPRRPSLPSPPRRAEGREAGPACPLVRPAPAWTRQSGGAGRRLCFERLLQPGACRIPPDR